MSGWGRWGYYDRYEPVAKKPPPERGIKMKKAGTTWWGQQWIQALTDVLHGDSARLARGRTYARAGRAHDLVVKGGKVTAKVTGSRATPYKITIELAELGEAAWKRAIAGMAEKAQFSAELLAGEMPKDIDDVFRAAGASLFPKVRADLVTTCSCPDWGDPCKHVAATHYVLGEALDRDPFLLFELRGKTKDQVLDALRAARGAEEEGPRKAGSGRGKSKAPAGESAPEIPVVTLGGLTTANYEKAREPLPSLRFTFDEPAAHGAVLTQLGAPASWNETGTPAGVLSPMVRAAAEMARRIAVEEPREPPPTEAGSPDGAAPKRRSKGTAKGRGA